MGWRPTEEFVQAASDAVSVRWYMVSDKLCLAARWRDSHGREQEVRMTLTGELVRANPAVLRVLGRVVRVWEGLAGEVPEGQPPAENGTE